MEGELILNIKQIKKEKLAEIKVKKRELNKNKKKLAKTNILTMGKVIRRKAETTVGSLPYNRIYKNGMLELINGKYSKTYGFSDISYKSAKDEERVNILLEYARFLNSVSKDVDLQVSVINKTIDTKRVYDDILAKTDTDIVKNIENQINENLGEQLNEVLKEALSRGENNKRATRYISISLEATDAKYANDRFLDIETAIIKKFKDISKETNLKPLEANELISVLADIYRENPKPREFNSNQLKLGTEKGYIASDGLSFEANYMKINNRYAKAIFIRDIPSYVTDELVSNLISTGVDLNLTLNIRPLNLKKIKGKLGRIKSDLVGKQINSQKKGAKDGVFVEITPQNILDSIKAADEMDDLIQNKKQGMFLFNMIIMFYADTKEELKIKEMALDSKASELMFSFGTLIFQQERAMQTCLPIGFNNLSINRTLTTESLATFTPFDRKETIQKNGFFYSLHEITKQAIVLNRNRLKAPSGFILGSSGSGKGMLAKQEMLNILFKTDDDIIILDPENEYARFVRMFGGATISLSSKTKDYINPFDIPLDDEDFQNGTPAHSLKLETILSIIDTMLGGDMHPGVLSLVDRILKKVYLDFEKHRTIEYIPTFKDFYAELSKDSSPLAIELTQVLEIYVTGSLDIFSHKTNVEIENRIVCFNTSNLGKRLSPVGSFLMFDAIWNRIAKNRYTGKKTWIYIDEIHLLFNSEESITRIDNMYRRFRKYNGNVTSMTQNASDTLKYKEARSMIANSDFVVVMNQKEHERREAVALLNIPEALVSNITNSGAGQGIIFSENMLIPFSNLFPKNNTLYDLMTTDPTEVAEITDRWKNDPKKKHLID